MRLSVHIKNKKIFMMNNDFLIYTFPYSSCLPIQRLLLFRIDKLPLPHKNDNVMMRRRCAEEWPPLRFSPAPAPLLSPVQS